MYHASLCHGQGLSPMLMAQYRALWGVLGVQARA
jgi:hypothetical protein